MHRRFLCLVLASVIAAFVLPAAAAAQTRPFSVGLQAGISYSGWNLALVGQYQLKSFSAYLGPSMSLNRGLPGKGPVGINTGVNYHIASSKTWLGSLVNLDYQVHFFNGASTQSTMIHELYLSYGLEFHVTQFLSVSQQFGYGGYLQSNPAIGGGDRRNFTGYGGLLRVKARYLF